MSKIRIPPMDAHTADGSPDEAARARAAELAGEELDNGVELAQVAQRGKRAVDEVTALLTQMERAIVLVDRELRVSQPPRQGKLGVRWWRPSAGRMRMPVLVEWWRARGVKGRWRARRVAQVRRDRILSDGSSGLCAENTYQLALVATRLIREYADLVSELRAIEARLARLAKRFTLVRSLEGRVMAEHREIIRKLDGAGYDIDASIRALPDAYLE